MKILIIRGNIQNAKSYPYWDELLSLLKDQEIKEIKGILSEQEIIGLINWCDCWISIDSFLPHLVKYYNLKPGITLWGKSDPKIFGYPDNINLLGDRKNLRPDQFRWWKDVEWRKEDFVKPEVIVSHLSLK